MSTWGVVIGVDVGGTNTDAVAMRGNEVIGSSKCVTTDDVTTGVTMAIRGALLDAHKTGVDLEVSRVHIGTTHFVNAVVQRKNLVRVAVIRLCGPASRALPPYSDFPEDLKQVVYGKSFMVSGGFQFNGQQTLGEIDEKELQSAVKELKQQGVYNVVVSGIFSPVNTSQEDQAAEKLKAMYPEVSVTLSHKVGQIGLLERENAAILNEALKPLCAQTVAAFRKSLDDLGLTCPFYLTQNDGTLSSAEHTLHLPIHIFGAGPTNSMRGAAYLSGVKDAVVLDIGGTSTDVGTLVAGFPREAAATVNIGDVRTNFRMPDVLSIGLGGGSLVRQDNSPKKVSIGPDSVGYKLEKEAIVFGGSTLTASDIAVAYDMVKMGDPAKVSNLDPDLLKVAMDTIDDMIETTIDSVKVSGAPVPAIVVGGGSILINENQPIKGISQIYKPKYFSVANAVGAALSQVSGMVDEVADLSQRSRQEVLDDAKQRAKQAAIQAGADASTVQILEVSDIPLTYLPGNATHLKVKAVGNLKQEEVASVKYTVTEEQMDKTIQMGVRKEITSPPENKVTSSAQEDFPAKLSAEETAPHIDAATGEWHLTEWDIECIAVGAGIMGCGGGGNPYLGRLLTKQKLREGKTLRVINPERMAKQMGPSDCVCNVAFMGAPLVVVEKLTSGTEHKNCLAALQDLYTGRGYKNGVLQNTDGLTIQQDDKGATFIDNYVMKSDETRATPPEGSRNIVALMPAEMGGLNGMEPLTIAADFGMAVVDADGMGRAFPELQMYTPNIYGHNAYPAVLADEAGNRSVVLKVANAKELENHFRRICVDMGCSASLTMNPLSSEDLTNKVVPFSISRAWRLGQAVIRARQDKVSPVTAILEHEAGQLVCLGKICDVVRVTEGGFDKGVVSVEGLAEFLGRTFQINLQNEYLVAKENSAGTQPKVFACTPDLICVVSCDTGQPIMTDELRYGLRVAILALPAPPLLRTPEALSVVGPQAFGYPEEEVTYTPLGDFRGMEPVPPK